MNSALKGAEASIFTSCLLSSTEDLYYKCARKKYIERRREISAPLFFFPGFIMHFLIVLFTSSRKEHGNRRLDAPSDMDCYECEENQNNLL